MFVTMLYRLANTPDTQAVSSFKDIKNSSAYYYKAVAWAKEAGITNGISASTFGVGKTITVKDAVTMLQRYDHSIELKEIDNIDLTSTQPATRAELAKLLMAAYK